MHLPLNGIDKPVLLINHLYTTGAMVHMRKYLFVILFITLLVGCDSNNHQSTSVKEEPIIISAAASLTDVLNEMKEKYEGTENVEIVFNFAGSGTLARQIEQGAPADIFISADEKWMDILAEKRSVDHETFRVLASNQLVGVQGNEQMDLEFTDINQLGDGQIEQIAIGHPESVPAGQYAQEAFKKLDVWQQIESKLILAKDVRQVLTYVETGNADVGIVYKSDALLSDNVQVVFEIDPKLHNEIVYSGVALQDRKNKEQALQFLNFLLAEENEEIWSNYGFKKPGD